MPSVQEILDDAQTRYPNSFSNDRLIYWANEILRKIWRYLNSVEIYGFTTISGQPLYTLPDDGVIDEILSIEIATDSTSSSYQAYEYKGLLDDSKKSNFFYDAFAGTLGIYPVPTESGLDAKIFYEKNIDLLSADNLDAIPGIDEEYHSLITNYICMKAASAGNNPDPEMRNVFSADFNDDWMRFYKNYIEKKIKNPRKKRCNKWWR